MATLVDNGHVAKHSTYHHGRKLQVQAVPSQPKKRQLHNNKDLSDWVGTGNQGVISPTKPVRQLVGTGLRHVNDYLLAEPHVDYVITSPLNKLWRAGILMHRASHHPQDTANKANQKEDPGKGSNTLQKKESREAALREKNAASNRGTTSGVNISIHDNLIKQKLSLDKTNQIILYNLTSQPYEYIVLQNRPNDIEFRGETTWAAIKSMGRNLPMYHFTGAEDTLQFNISWYCNDPDNPDEVVAKCRFLEAWTKANGYHTSPPVIRIQWGSGDIFKDQTFILTSATYTLSNFSNGYCAYGSDRGYTYDDAGKPNIITKHTTSRNVTIQNGKLLPSTATQELIFKRVSATNPTWEDILPVASAKPIKGIKITTT